MDINAFNRELALIQSEEDLLAWVEQAAPKHLAAKARLVIRHRRQQLAYERRELLILAPELATPQAVLTPELVG